MGKEDRLSVRIQFEEQDYNFMKDYKESHFISTQDFVENAVKKEILLIKAQLHLKEL